MHFLHIADVHFGCECRNGLRQADIAARNNYMKKLTDTILAIHRRKKLDFILFTGDIAFSASAKEYVLAAQWLNKVLRDCNLDAQHLFVCPGNHDIDRGEAEDLQFPNNQAMANRFLQVEKLPKLSRRFSDYIKFCGDMGFEPYKIGQEESFLVGLRDMGDYRIVCLNTAWFAINDEVRNDMWIGAGFTEILSAQLSEQEKPTITMMHHPKTCWHEEECSNFDGTDNVYAAVCTFSDLVLTGHCHETSTELESAHNALIGGTGALFERKNYSNCFYEYDIDFSAKPGQKRICHFWHNNSWHHDSKAFSLCRTFGARTPAQSPTPPTGLLAYENESMQSNLYSIANKILRYVPIIGSWNPGEAEYYRGDFKFTVSSEYYRLPKEIMDCFYSLPYSCEEFEGIEGNVLEPKVRLDNYRIQLRGGARPHYFQMQFSKAAYRDFLIEKAVMDQKLPSGQTVREKYLSETNALVSHALPNVCGVGIFVITSDQKLLISEASPYVIVNPNQLIYSASGSMDWNGEATNPFEDVIRECKEEIGYMPSIETLKLYSVGMDYATGYYQFSFYERANIPAAEIMQRARMARDFRIEIKRIIPIDFTLDGVMDILSDENPWDETAKANLFTLAVKNFGIDAVKKRLSPSFERTEYRQKVTQMWRRRAQRSGRFPVLSSRYPVQDLDRKSDEYVEAVLQFIDEDLSDKSILEVGGGIGLFTKHFAEQAKEITCVDVCEEMIEKNRQNLGSELAEKVDYVHAFIQDYETDKHFDLLVCSLVLIHNASELEEITTKMKELSDVIYLFEHTDQQTQVGMYTDIKTAAEYIAMFSEYTVKKRSAHMLCQDSISFIKLCRKRESLGR